MGVHYDEATKNEEKFYPHMPGEEVTTHWLMSEEARLGRDQGGMVQHHKKRGEETRGL
jgi:hypothetical protein